MKEVLLTLAAVAAAWWLPRRLLGEPGTHGGLWRRDRGTAPADDGDEL